MKGHNCLLWFFSPESDAQIAKVYWVKANFQTLKYGEKQKGEHLSFQVVVETVSAYDD